MAMKGHTAVAAEPQWHGRVVVVSPHLDDAVLSLGASIRAVTRRGAHVEVLTVLAGDPDSTAPSDDSGRRAGFATVGEAARFRREEDWEACRIVGAQPRWLPLSDVRGAKPAPEEIRAELRPVLAGYDAVLVPGGPLTNGDHRLVGRAALDVLPRGALVGLYREQPYASWKALSRKGRLRDRGFASTTLDTLGLTVDGPLSWRRHGGRPADWRAKIESMGAYPSQVRVLRKAPRTRILAYEALHGGEAICWLSLVDPTVNS